MELLSVLGSCFADGLAARLADATDPAGKTVAGEITRGLAGKLAERTLESQLDFATLSEP